MKFRQTILLLIGLGMIAGLVACGSSSHKTIPPPITVTLSATPTSLFVNDTTPITATTNDSAGVNWSCAPAGTCGTFSSPGSLTGIAVTYTAPAAVPASTVVITATSVTDTTKSASTPAITISAASGITVTLSTAPPASMATSATAPVAATTSDTAGVNWTVTCGSAGACGSFSSASTLSTVPTTYTAPAAVPTGNTVTITATSVTDNAQSASATVTITPAVSTSLGNGTYVFSLAGQDAAGAYLYYVAGAFTISGGAVTGGEQDFTDYSGNPELFDSIASGTVTTTADGNVQITLTTCTATDCTTPDPFVGVGGVETLNATLVSSTRALVNEFDTSATSSGELDLQTATTQTCSTPPCGYAFFLNGGDNANGFATGIGGVVTITGSGVISGAGSVFDIDDGGTVLQNQPIDSGTVSNPDSFGRITIDLVLTTSGIGGIGLTGYIVDSNRVRLVENGDASDIFFGVTGGTAYAQGASTGTFSATSIEGSSFVFGATGQDINGYLQVAGVVTTNLDGTTVNGTLNSNDLTGAGVQAPEAFTGTYTVDPTGRVTLSSLTVGTGITVQLYLTGGSRAYTVAMDGGDEWAGPAYLQTGAGSFTAGSFAGPYAFDATGFGLPFFGAEFDAVGPVSSDGVSALTSSSLDQNILGGTPTTPISLTDGFTANASGIFTGTLTGLDITTPANTDAFAYYLIDTTKVVAIETDANQLTLGYFELQ